VLSRELQIRTGGRRVVDVTERVRAFAAEAASDGLVHVFLPHATAGVALMETGSGSEPDLEELLERLLQAPTSGRRCASGGAAGAGDLCG
jgi:thiamine phosphate synthase YjbQ (UPF0047 family)